MKLAALGLATALVFTGTYALAQFHRDAAEFGHGWRGNKRHERRDLPTTGTTTGNATGSPHRHEQQRRQRRGRAEQRD